jgi:hypothetical protein
MQADVVVPVLVRGTSHASKAQRRLAAELLGARPGNESARALARAVVLDDVPAVRMQAIASLTTLRHPETASLFIQALARREPFERMRAAEALRFFPDRDAVGALLDTSTIRAGSVARAHVFFGSERAYISGYELTAGGTGIVVAEVAKPIVQVHREGVSLEVAVAYTLEYEWSVVRVGVLRFLTGEKLAKPKDWQAWWSRAEKGFRLAPEAAALAIRGP